MRSVLRSELLTCSFSLLLIASRAFVHDSRDGLFTVSFQGTLRVRYKTGWLSKNIPRLHATIESSTDLSKVEFTSDEQVFDILQDLNIRQPWKTPDVSTRTFNYVLNQLSNRRSDAGPTCERILQYMLQECSQRPELTPDNISFNTVLAAYKNMNTLEAAEAAYKLLQKSEMPMDRISYNTVLSAFVRASKPQLATQVFQELQNRYKESGNDEAWQPDAVSYSTLLRGYAGQVKQAEALLQDMKDNGPPPTVEFYNEVLYAYSKSKEPSRAEEFLQRWRNEEETVRPNLRSYNIVLHGLVQSADYRSMATARALFNSMPRKDAVSYTTLIAACSRMPGRMAQNAIDDILQQAWKDRAVQVDAAFVSNVLFSLATCDDTEMPTFAEKLVADMNTRNVPVDIHVFNALIYCWAKSGNRDAGQRVLDILSELEKRDDLKADIKTYTNVLDCLAKSRERVSHAEAEAIVGRMEKFGIEPNTHAYTSLIQNYARSSLPLKAVKARDVLERMKKSVSTKPNIVSYNAVLNAAEHTDPSDRAAAEEALRVACVIFDEIRTAPVRPNHVTYGSFLGALANLMPPDARQEIVSLVFRRCCMEGQVSRLVLKKLKEAAETHDRYRRLLQGQSLDDLPREWTRNVREAKARHL